MGVWVWGMYSLGVRPNVGDVSSQWGRTDLSKRAGSHFGNPIPDVFQRAVKIPSRKKRGCVPKLHMRKSDWPGPMRPMCSTSKNYYGGIFYKRTTRSGSVGSTHARRIAFIASDFQQLGVLSPSHRKWAGSKAASPVACRMPYSVESLGQ